MLKTTVLEGQFYNQLLQKINTVERRHCSFSCYIGRATGRNRICWWIFYQIKRRLGRPKRRCEDNVKIYIKEKDIKMWTGSNWLGVQCNDGFLWTQESSVSTKGEKFLDDLRDCHLHAICPGYSHNERYFPLRLRLWRHFYATWTCPRLFVCLFTHSAAIRAHGGPSQWTVSYW
jgi:hypothetical protein